MILAAAFEKVTERIYSRNFALLTLPAYYSFFFFFFALFYSSGTLHSLDFFFNRRFYSSVSDNHVSPSERVDFSPRFASFKVQHIFILNKYIFILSVRPSCCGFLSHLAVRDPSRMEHL